MTIQQQDDRKNGSFFINENDEQLALMTYRWAAPNLFIIEHTEVNKQLEGKGIGKQLVQHAVEFARKKGYKIHPTCSFANAVMHHSSEYKDVLK